MTPAMISETLASLAPQYDRLLSPLSLDTLPMRRRFGRLSAENRQLREELRRLNEFIGALFESRGRCAKSDVSHKSAAGESSHQAKAQEFENLQRQVQLLGAEYLRHKGRANQIADPGYLPELKGKLVSLELKTKKLEKSRRVMGLAERKNAPAAERVEESFAGLQQVIKSLSSEISVLDAKLKKIDHRTAQQTATLREQAGKLAEVKANWKRVSDAAPSEKQLQDENAELEARRLNAARALTLFRSRYAMAAGEYSQKKLLLQARIAEAANALRKKDGYICVKYFD